MGGRQERLIVFFLPENMLVPKLISIFVASPHPAGTHTYDEAFT